MGDMAGHGGFIVYGEPTVWIGGQPAARKGDPIVCPMFDGPKPHVGGVITMGSATVLIGGMPAARMGDLTGCTTVGIPGIAIPVLGPPLPAPPALPTEAPALKASTDGKFHEQTDKAKGGGTAMHAEGQITDSDKDGTYDTVEGTAEGARIRNTAYGNLGPIEGGLTNSMDILYATGKASAHTGVAGGSVSGTAEAGMMKWNVGGSVAPANSNGRNPYAAVNAEANMFHAKAEGDALYGHDGSRTGLALKGEAGAEVLQGEISGTATTPSIFGYNLQGKAKVGASAGSAAIGGGVWLYYDHNTGRLNAGISGKLAAFVGLEGDVEFSAGREFQDPDAPPPPTPPTMNPGTIDFITIPGFGAGGIPGMVALGCPTVLIGG